ncbi:hypothetical protein [Streptomyces sp. NPDC058240]|uniref:hypothetical protein n=1 Tax=Streptomyces sp. NPDC058240 TaxID=3346396 RepID=UPI0036E66B50
MFVNMLREHIDRFGIAPDGRLFRNEADGYAGTAAYGRTWARAREDALDLGEHAVMSADRLRTSTMQASRSGWLAGWLASRADAAECARRAGHSIQVPFGQSAVMAGS